jgi:hypothetical protein
MHFRKVVLFGILLLFGTSLYAQDFQKVEVFGEYSYLRFNPTLNYLKNRSFNGGGGGVQFNFTEHFGIKGEFMGYGSTNFTIPAGTFQSSHQIRLSSMPRLQLRAICSPICSGQSSECRSPG